MSCEENKDHQIRMIDLMLMIVYNSIFFLTDVTSTDVETTVVTF